MATTPPVPLPHPDPGRLVTGHIGTTTPAKPVTPAKPKPSRPKIPSAAVSRASVAAAQAAAAPPTATPKTFQPWARVIAAAEHRMRGRLALALAELEHNLGTAGQILDTAEQAAKEAESQILAAAWARWHQDIDAAADTSAAIMDPARLAYTQLVEKAGGDYDQAIRDARASYEAELSRAQSAAQLAASMPSAAAS